MKSVYRRSAMMLAYVIIHTTRSIIWQRVEVHGGTTAEPMSLEHEENPFRSTNTPANACDGDVVASAMGQHSPLQRLWLGLKLGAIAGICLGCATAVMCFWETGVSFARDSVVQGLLFVAVVTALPAIIGGAFIGVAFGMIALTTRNNGAIRRQFDR